MNDDVQASTDSLPQLPLTEDSARTTNTVLPLTVGDHSIETDQPSFQTYSSGVLAAWKTRLEQLSDQARSGQQYGFQYEAAVRQEYAEKVNEQMRRYRRKSCC